jgi:hypothetical protein
MTSGRIGQLTIHFTSLQIGLAEHIGSPILHLLAARHVFNELQRVLRVTSNLIGR